MARVFALSDRLALQLLLPQSVEGAEHVDPAGAAEIAAFLVPAEIARTSRPPGRSSRARCRRIDCQSALPWRAKAASSAPEAPTAWTWSEMSQGLALSQCMAVAEKPRSRLPLGRIWRWKEVAENRG